MGGTLQLRGDGKVSGCQSPGLGVPFDVTAAASVPVVPGRCRKRAGFPGGLGGSLPPTPPVIACFRGTLPRRPRPRPVWPRAQPWSS